MRSTCFACTHPDRELIDTYCRARRVVLEDGEVITSAERLHDVLLERHPNCPSPSPPSISKHKKAHVSARPDGPMAIVAKVKADGTVETVDGRTIRNFPPKQALAIMISLGVDDMLRGISKISPSNVAEAINLFIKLGAITKDDASYGEALADFVKDRVARELAAKQSPTSLEGKYTVVETVIGNEETD